MPVDSRHPEYDKYLPIWQRSRDVVAGEDAVKDGGEKYLPKLSGQNDKEYTAYKARAAFFNATGRTVDGLTGLIFRNDPTYDVPTQIEAIADDITLTGISLKEFAQKLVEEAIVLGRGGILIDYPPTGGVEMTEAERQALNLRPYLVLYKAEQVLDWQCGRINNRWALTMVKLSESVDIPDEKDEWKRKTVEQIRVLKIVDSTTDAGEPVKRVMVQLFRKKQSEAKGVTEWLPEGDPAFPSADGAPLAEIPFVFVGPVDSSPDVQKAPIYDLVLTNLSHYRSSADYENGLHWTGVPTPVFIGDFITTKGEEVTTVKLGGSEGIHLVQDGDAKFLEFQGDGLEGGLGKALERKEQQMAVLGARILAPEKRQAEAAETASIHRAGENSALASLALSMSKSIVRALNFVALYLGIGDESIAYELNTDYLPTRLSAQELAALVKAWQDGGLSGPELFDALKSGEIVAQGKDYADHEAEIEADKEKRQAEQDRALLAAAAVAAARGVGTAEA